jgi:acyl carrier protein
MQDQAAPANGEQAFQVWLATRIAEYVRQPANAIQLDVPLSEYGLDSVYALTLAGEIEDHLGVSLDPTLMWDYPTLRKLSEALTGDAAAVK